MWSLMPLNNGGAYLVCGVSFISCINLIPLGQHILKNQLTKIRQNHGSVMRLDHTYKVTAALTAWSALDNCNISLRSSLLIIMDELGQIMATKICPNDEVERSHDVTFNDTF
jgi:hypothetical protein